MTTGTAHGPCHGHALAAPLILWSFSLSFPWSFRSPTPRPWTPGRRAHRAHRATARSAQGVPATARARGPGHLATRHTKPPHTHTPRHAHAHRRGLESVRVASETIQHTWTIHPVHARSPRLVRLLTTEHASAGGRPSRLHSQTNHMDTLGTPAKEARRRGRGRAMTGHNGRSDGLALPHPALTPSRFKAPSTDTRYASAESSTVSPSSPTSSPPASSSSASSSSSATVSASS